MNAPLQVVLPTVLLPIGSNLFMTCAWYGHMKTLADKPWLAAALVRWGIAPFEYLLQVPANRIGFGGGMSAPGRSQALIPQHAVRRVVQ